MGSIGYCNLFALDQFLKNSLNKSRIFSYANTFEKHPDWLEKQALYIITYCHNDHRLFYQKRDKVIYKPFQFYFQGQTTQQQQILNGTLALPTQLPVQDDKFLKAGQSEYMNFRGQFLNNIPNKGTLSYANGQELIRDEKFNFEKKKNRNTGKQQRLISIMLPNGVRYKGQISNNSKKLIITGLGQMIFPNGDHYKGRFYDGRISGYGDFYYQAKKHQYSGYFRQGLKVGEGTYYFTQDRKNYLKGIWKNDKIDEEIQVQLMLNGKPPKRGFWNHGKLLSSNLQE